MGWMRRAAVALALAWLVTIMAPPPARAQSGSVVAERYDVGVEILPDGALAVVERLALDFSGGPFRRGTSTIALDRVEAIRDVQVGEPGRPYERGSERPYTYATIDDGKRLEIAWWFPPTQDGRREFEIRYRVEGALRIYPGGDQLYWSAIEADRRYPVRQSTVEVRLPAEVAPEALRAAAYPERQRVAFQQVDPRTVRFETRELAPGMGLVVRVQFPHGLVAAEPPRWQAEADRVDWLEQNLRPALNFLLLLTTLLILFGGLVSLGVLWRVRGSDPTVARGAPVLETPPSDLPAPLVGTLLDQRADSQDVVATLVDLANRGVIRIAEVEGDSLAGGGRDYELERLTRDDANLRDYERLLLLTLFGEGDRVRLSQTRATFAAAIPGLQAALHREVARAGLFHEDPAAVRKRYAAIGWGLVGGSIVGAIVVGGWLARYADLALLPFFALLVVGGVTLWLAGHMPRRTRAGALAADRWAAFRRHLERVAAGSGGAGRDDLERYLPYATAFGLDRAWMGRMAAVGAPAPAWYQGHGGPVLVPVPYGSWDRGSQDGGSAHLGRGGSTEAPGSGGDPVGSSGGDPGFGGLQDFSDSLSDMLNQASGVFSHGGGSDWSGGGFGDFGGGGDSGGGGGGFGGDSGASGGGSSGFD